MNNFYIYIYLDPRKPGQCEYGDYCFLYEPFYIGKGKDRRWKNMKWRRSCYFKNKINKIKELKLEPIVIKLKKHLNEKQSYILEIKLINLIGRKDLGNGPLINFTDGGMGSNKRIFNEKTLHRERKNFQEIKNEFENRKYQLLIKEKEYKNNRQKLDYICPIGHKHSIRWSHFKQGHGCPYCKNELSSKKQRKNFSDIKNKFEEKNFVLLTKEEEYINSKQKLNYICSCSYNKSISWNDFKQGKYHCKNVWR